METEPNLSDTGSLVKETSTNGQFELNLPH